MSINSPESQPEDGQQGAVKDGTVKDDGGIPANGSGVGLGATHEPNTFEPEEDPVADEG